MEAKIDEIVRLGQPRGFVTFEQVNALLDAENPTPEEIDRLLERLENAGIELLGEDEVIANLPAGPQPGGGFSL